MYIRNDEPKKERCVNLNGSEMEPLAKMMIGFKSDSERENGLAAKIVCKYLQEKNYAESSPDGSYVDGALAVLYHLRTEFNLYG